MRPVNKVEPHDPYDLNRFLQAQEDSYDRALAEIRSGCKQTHWMWYIFPQLTGLAFSSTSLLYAIKNIEEAKAYLAHPILGPRLLECFQAAVAAKSRSARQAFGSPDDLKLRSCATLFATVTLGDSVFRTLLDKYYGGERDEKTVSLLRSTGGE